MRKSRTEFIFFKLIYGNEVFPNEMFFHFIKDERSISEWGHKKFGEIFNFRETFLSNNVKVKNEKKLSLKYNELSYILGVVLNTNIGESYNNLHP